MVCLICALSDAILIVIGVSGFSLIVAKASWVEQVARYAGALFLIVYGTKSFWSALTIKYGLNPAQESHSSLLVIFATCLAVTWLNPHVYLDTVVLLGSVSTQYIGQKLEFVLGAVLASFIFFFALGYGGRI